MTDPEGVNSRRIMPRFLLLTLILSVLPFFLLSADVKNARRLQMEDAKCRRLEEIRQIGARFPEITTPGFWAEETSRRLKKRVEKALSGVPSTPERLAAAFDASLEAAHPTGIRGGRLWATFLPDQRLDTPGTLLSGKRLESKLRLILSQLLHDLTRDYLHLPSDLDNKIIIDRLKGIFGEGASRKLFSREQRGKAFYTIFQGEFGIAVWDVVMDRGRPIGTFLLILPTDDQAYQTACNAALLNWRTLFPGERVWPAFIPFRVSPKDDGAPPVLHQDVAKFAQARRIARRLQREMHIIVRRGNTLATAERSESPSTGFPLAPTYRLLEPFSDGSWWGLPCRAAPLAGGIGLLLTPAPHIVPMFSERLARVYGLILAIFWTLFPVWVATGGRMSTPGVRMTLLLWFAGLAATPVALIIGSGDRLQLDLTSNLRDRLDHVISSTLQKIDAESARIDVKFAQSCRSMIQIPDLGERIERSREHPDEGRAILSDLWRMCPPEMSVQGIMIFGYGSYALTRFAPDTNPAETSITAWYCQGIAGDYLRSLNPVLAAECDKKQTRVSSAARLSQVGLLNKNKSFLKGPDTVEIWTAGTTQLLRYFNVIRRGGRCEYAIMVIWNQDEAYEPYLRKALRRTVRERGGIALAAFKVTSDGRELVARAGNSNHLALMAQRLKPWGLPLEADGLQMSLIPLQKMTGFQLAAVAPLDSMNARIAAEHARSLVSLAILAILIIGGAILLSRRLASPIVHMTDALVRISADNLDGGIDVGRCDELGDAARKLDVMTARLRERRMMSRFVAPQVRDVVAQGDLDKACEGTERHVALLVSDVRNFTTMSEVHSPKAIFDLINEHLKIMTTVIQRHGGAVDRFIGDAVQAVFYPGSGVSMVIRALRAAREMMDAHRDLNEKRRSSGLFEYDIGVGVELGTVVTGVIGDPEVRLDFTVLGEPMKHCADLEGASKFGRATRIVCSAEVRESAREAFSFIPLVDPEHRDAWEMTFDESFNEESRGGVPENADILEGTGMPAGESRESRFAFDTGSDSGHFDSDKAYRAPTWDTVSENYESHIRSGAASSIGFAGVFALLIFWMLPVFLIGFAFHSLETGEIQRIQRDIRAKLEDDRKRAEAGLEPRNQISLELFHRLNRISSKIRSLPDDVLAAHPSILPSVIIKPGISLSVPIAQSSVRSDVMLARYDLHAAACAEMKRIAGHLASPSWYLFGHCAEREWLARQPSVESVVLVASGGLPVASELTDDVAKCLFAKLKTYLLKIYFPSALDLIDSVLGSRVGDVYYDAMGQLSQISALGRPRCLFWIPIFDPSFQSTFEQESKLRGSRFFDAYGWMRRYLIGGIVLFIEPAALTPENGRRALVENLAAAGCVAAVQPLISGSRAMVHRKFRIDRELRARFLGNFVKDSRHRWETVETVVPGRPSVRILIARRSGSQDNPFPRGRAVLEFIAAVWVCAGLYGAFVLGLLSRPFAFSLRGQLVTAFLFVLVPALVLGMFAVERSSCEKSDRLEMDQRRLLMETLSSAEETYHLYLSWSCAILDHIVMKQKFISYIIRNETMNEQDANRIGPKIMSVLMKACLHNGVFLNRPMISDTGRLCLLYQDSKSQRKPGFMEKGLRSFIVTALESLKGSSGRTPDGLGQKKLSDKLVLGFGLEEFMRLVLSFSAPNSIMELMLSPRALNFVKRLDDQSFFYHRFLSDKHGPRYGLFSTMNMDIINYLLLNCWTISRQSSGSSQSVLGYGFRKSPGVTLTRPYGVFHNDEHDYEFDYRFIPQAPDLAEGVFWASFADAPIFLDRKSGKRRELVLCVPPKAMPDSILTAQVPIGLKMEEQASDATEKRNVLAWLLLAAAVLAMQVAGEFLKPVKELSEKAGMITAGRFDARLSEWRGGEFGILARAFNAMATGVSEGKLLSRFVSKSVRDAAGDAGREEAASRGEQRDVTILFAGLADFKALLAHTSPDVLIRLLNQYLQVMSRGIRAHGGEIDKFIGDKILAVFHNDALGGRDAAATAAVEAALRMRHDHEHLQRQLQGMLPNHLGIGVVSGAVLAGIMGTPDVRLEYTVIGDTVNLASRLGDLALRVDEAGAVWPDTTDCVGAVIVESVVAAAFAKSQEMPARDCLRKLELPPIKGKTRSVEAFVVLSNA
ncbi:MAG: HAMP domain-containing protein [Candidatus Riflebacteria bacterium]|nr:HAMP domain-containing protein [Candidatus Riflebacteria bacterium]